MSFALRILSPLLCSLALLAPTAARADDAAQLQRLQEAAQLADRYVQPPLRFAPCRENATLDCGSLRVPVDYRKPWAGSVDVAVARARSTPGGRRLGVLVVNPGGPGESGVDQVLNGVNAPGFVRLRSRFDIVSFDVRGSHRSQAVQCAAPFPASPAPADVDAFSHQIAKACLQQGGALTMSMSTNNMARDVDILRRSLGERQITFVGQSYGTALGAVYASMFPRSLRAMLLDAGLTPSFRDGHVEMSSEQALSFEGVFQHVDQRCSADTLCRLRGAGVSKTLLALKNYLNQTPIGGPGGVVLTAGNVAGVMSVLLSHESQWPLLVDALADAAAGNFTLLFQLVAFNAARADAQAMVTAGPMLTMTPLRIIRCNDFGTRRFGAEVLPVSEAVSAVSSLVIERFAVLSQVAPCAAWPEADVPLMQRLSGPQAVPTLLIGAHQDPNTPLAWTRQLALVLDLERNVLRYRGGGHVSYAQSGNSCIDAAGDAFLFDLVLPAEGSSCAARPVVFRAAGAATTDASARARVEELRRAMRR